MGMFTCKECGNSISNKADACPHCGARIRRTSFTTWAVTFIIGVSIVMGIAANNSPSPAPTPLTESERAAKAAIELRFQKTAIVAAKIKQALREPDSVVWDEILSDDAADTICLQYRARNGFGGMNQEFTVVHNGKASQRTEDWNQRCANRELYDMKRVRYAIK